MSPTAPTLLIDNFSLSLMSIFCSFYATEKNIMHFLEPPRFLSAPDLAGCKVNLLYDPGLAQRPPSTPHHGHKVFGPWNNHSVLICIKLPMNLFFIWRLSLMILLRGKDITWTVGRVGLKVSPVLGPNRTHWKTSSSWFWFQILTM